MNFQIEQAGKRPMIVNVGFARQGIDMSPLPFRARAVDEDTLSTAFVRRL
jgi:hypothetical protein